MDKETKDTSEPAPREGATTDLPHDRMTVERFREAFPRARWSDSLNAWFVPGRTAGKHIGLFIGTDGELADKATIDGFYFPAADGEEYVWAIWLAGGVGDDLAGAKAAGARRSKNAAGGYRCSRSCGLRDERPNPGGELNSARTNHPVREQQTTLEVFRSLPPIEPRELVGLWKGRGIPAGHPLDGVLENLGWFGKRFRPDMRADALLFRSSERRLIAVDPRWIPLRLALRFHKIGRTHLARHLFSYIQRWLRARGPVAVLKTMVFGGIESAAMAYDHQPIVDYFRRIDQQRVMGAMTIRGDGWIYFFELERIEETS